MYIGMQQGSTQVGPLLAAAAAAAVARLLVVQNVVHTFTCACNVVRLV